MASDSSRPPGRPPALPTTSRQGGAPSAGLGVQRAEGPSSGWTGQAPKLDLPAHWERPGRGRGLRIRPGAISGGPAALAPWQSEGKAGVWGGREPPTPWSPAGQRASEIAGLRHGKVERAGSEGPCGREQPAAAGAPVLSAHEGRDLAWELWRAQPVYPDGLSPQPPLARRPEPARGNRAGGARYMVGPPRAGPVQVQGSTPSDPHPESGSPAGTRDSRNGGGADRSPASSGRLAPLRSRTPIAVHLQPG